MENQKNHDLNFENEFLKLKIIAESGAFVSENKLPPEVENDFLKNIIAFEEAAREKKIVKFFDKIERPHFSLDIDDNLLPSELERLLDHLDKHHINVSSICEVSDREFYRFIIEDLFEETINDIPNLESGFTCFTYEDFYPNHPHDIANRLKDFLQVLSKKEIGLYSWVFASEFTSTNGNILNEGEVTKCILSFFNQFHSITIPILETKNLQITGDKAVASLYMKIEVTTTDTKVSDLFEGKGKISLDNSYGWWCISGVDIPGLKI
jgi:hypothetical protein